MYSVLARSAEECAELRSELRLAGVETRPLFHPVHLLPPYFSGLSFPVAEQLSPRGINLPSFPGLERHEVATICAILRSHYSRRGSKIVSLR
jgi:perosamine synthetase